MARSASLKNQFLVDSKSANLITSDFTLEQKLDIASEGLTPEYKDQREDAITNLSDKVLKLATEIEELKKLINKP